MDYFVGIDASLETVNVCIVDREGSILLEQKVKRSFETRALELVEGHPKLAAITLPLLRVRRVLLEEFSGLDRIALKIARNDTICRRLMSVPASV